VRHRASNKEQSRQRILDVAGRLFRERGYNGVGIDAVMAEAGLTAGAFYFHFPSKEALFSEAISHALEARRSSLKETRADQPGAEGLKALIKGYLSRSHRDDVAGGCAFPSLAPDMSRASPAARVTFEEQISRFVAAVEEEMAGSNEERREQSIGIVAQLIGGIMLARAVPDKEFSDRILRACRRAALAIGGDGTPQQQPGNAQKIVSSESTKKRGDKSLGSNANPGSVETAPGIIGDPSAPQRRMASQQMTSSQEIKKSGDKPPHSKAEKERTHESVRKRR
jgi:TetR/AcrR family transcriptional repressor of nem operon